MGDLRKFLADVSAVEYPVKTSRRMVILSGVSTVLAVFSTCIIVLLPGPQYGSLALNLLCLVFSAAMLKRANRKLVESKHRAEQRKFLAYMYSQWA